MNATCANDLYKLRNNNYENFWTLLCDIKTKRTTREFNLVSENIEGTFIIETEKNHEKKSRKHVIARLSGSCFAGGMRK